MGFIKNLLNGPANDEEHSRRENAPRTNGRKRPAWGLRRKLKQVLAAERRAKRSGIPRSKAS